MRREYGGCAGNIAYNLKLLGGEPLIMATVGDDFAPYADRLDNLTISRNHIRHMPGTYTAQAFITTDLDDNQITAFHPGAMNSSHLNEVPTDAGIRLGIVSPDGRDGMLEHAAQFKAANIPFIFDPGQGLPMFGGAELTAFIDQASWVTVNDYECELLQERTGLTPQAMAERVDAVIVTLGAKGSHIYTQNKRIEIPSAKISSAADPTGCGDAYRAGLLYGIMNDLDWETTGRIAALMGAMKIEHPGTQNHSFTNEEFAARFKNEFGSSLKM
jgi:adenosine kinase